MAELPYANEELPEDDGVLEPDESLEFLRQIFARRVRPQWALALYAASGPEPASAARRGPGTAFAPAACVGAGAY